MLALICGTGHLPKTVAKAQDTPPMICVLDGFPPDGLKADLTFRLETLGSTLAALRARGVTEICLCGAISRPEIDPAAIDAATQPLVPVLAGAIASGDDGALRAVIGILQDYGFVVRAAAELAPNILPPEGVLTKTPSAKIAEADLAAAEDALVSMGARDLGQACLVRDGIVIAQEDARGTDAMLMDMMDTGEGKSAVLFKAPKPGQDRRADLPTIGPATAGRAVEAGLSGIVVEAGGCIILDLAQVIQILEDAGLFLWVRAS